MLRLPASLSTGGSVAYARSMGVTPEDSALMLRYKDGDVAAFETLYRRHHDSLYRYLLRLSQNHATAEDVFQDVWSNIIKARHRYRPTAKFSTFLYRVAHNCFIDYLRKNNRHAVNSVLDPDCSPDPGDEPDLIVEKRFARQRLEAALGTLPDEQRDAFLLHEEAGLNIDTIAQVTGANRETVKSRLRYANKKLKAALADPAVQTQRTA
jgi:RNA polymerase sigma-70 factor (ECF subfamily)